MVGVAIGVVISIVGVGDIIIGSLFDCFIVKSVLDSVFAEIGETMVWFEDCWRITVIGKTKMRRKIAVKNPKKKWVRELFFTGGCWYM